MKDYKKILKGVINIIATTEKTDIGFAHICSYLSDNCDELFESEDDRIRKALITYFQRFPYPYGGIESAGTNAKEALAWLEKQESIDENKVIKRVKIDISTSLINYINANSKGMYLSDIECEDIEDAIVNNKWYKVYNYMKKELEKQEEKPQGKTALGAVEEEKVDNSNKIERKFKVSDWIIHQGTGNIYQVVAVIDNQYQLKYGDNYTIQKCADVDKNTRLWDIAKDAKNGDVLASYDIVFIFNKIHNKIHDVWINCHCSAHKDGSFMEEDYDLMTIKYSKEVYPATKEQRDTLMKAMADAGWQFNFEKKELKLLITNGDDFKQENCEQKPAWSKEDEQILLGIIDEIEANKSEAPEYDYKTYDRFINWLESIKERINNKKKGGEE